MTQLIRGWQFPELAPTRRRRHWWWRRLASTGESRLYGRPKWLAMWHHGTARRTYPAALVHTFTHWAAPDYAHGGVRSVNFRTSLPTSRPEARGAVPAGRGTAVRRPLPRRAVVGRGRPSSSGASLVLINVACTLPIVGRVAGSDDSIASTRSASCVGIPCRGMRSVSPLRTATAGSWYLATSNGGGAPVRYSV
jgi:hypothetical protein